MTKYATRYTVPVTVRGFAFNEVGSVGDQAVAVADMLACAGAMCGAGHPDDLLREFWGVFGAALARASVARMAHFASLNNDVSDHAPLPHQLAPMLNRVATGMSFGVSSAVRRRALQPYSIAAGGLPRRCQAAGAGGRGGAQARCRKAGGGGGRAGAQFPGPRGGRGRGVPSAASSHSSSSSSNSSSSSSSSESEASVSPGPSEDGGREGVGGRRAQAARAVELGAARSELSASVVLTQGRRSRSSSVGGSSILSGGASVAAARGELPACGRRASGDDSAVSVASLSRT